MNIAEKEILIAENEIHIAENVPRVHQTGYDKGYYQGYTEGEEIGFSDGWMDNENMVVGELHKPVRKVEDYTSVECDPIDSVGMIQYIDENLPTVYENGKKSEHDRFWDSILNNGSRTTFLYGFSGQCWTAETFVPNRDIIVTNGNNMFMYSRMKIDLVEHFENIGRTIDFTQNAGWNNTFYQSYFTRIGEIDTSKVATLTSTFSYTVYLEKIDKLILKSDGSQSFSNTFEAARALKDIVIEGIIGNNISFQYSPLSKYSITSIINALKSTASGKKLTLNKAAVNTAFGINVDDETTFPIGSEYYNLRHSKDNWNFIYMDA